MCGTLKITFTSQKSGKYARLPQAFSLLELLIVIGIVILLTVSITAAYNGLLQPQNLNRAASEINGVLQTARTRAMAENLSLQVRFVRLGDTLFVHTEREYLQENPSPQPPTLVIEPVLKSRSFQNIRLRDVPTSTNRPSVVAEGILNLADGGEQRIRFNNRGEAVLVDAPLQPRIIELGLMDSVSGNPRNDVNYAAVQIVSLTGAVITYRP